MNTNSNHVKIKVSECPSIWPRGKVTINMEINNAMLERIAQTCAQGGSLLLDISSKNDLPDQAFDAIEHGLSAVIDDHLARSD
jgi:hypothetical protein